LNALFVYSFFFQSAAALRDVVIKSRGI